MTVTTDDVELSGPGGEVTARHGGVRPGLAAAVNELSRARDATGSASRSGQQIAEDTEAVPLRHVGELLAESFLPRLIADQLQATIMDAERAHQPVRLGVHACPELAGLPWEALRGPSGGALALHPLVSVYRMVPAAKAVPLPGPLRVVVAIAAPSRGGGVVLDYERELRNVLAAVRAARQDDADVAVVPFATMAAIREELGRSHAHVLHISGHGTPGKIVLEDDDGAAVLVSADEFTGQAIPPGKMPPLVTLAACHTDVPQDSGGTSFAAGLCERGAAGVIATEASVTEAYVTRMLARFYAELARSRDPDPVSAFSDARRVVQGELEASPDKRDQKLAGRGDWAAVTILAPAGEFSILDPGRRATVAPGRVRPKIAGLAGRDDWYFVGRRVELRTWPKELSGTSPCGIVIYGIGGTGKTTLAAEVATRLRDRDPVRVLVGVSGSLTLEAFLAAVTSAVRRELLVKGHDTGAIQALDVVARADLPWADRYTVLREHVLGTLPLLVVLDNFEDSLRADDRAGHVVADEALAGLLSAWVTDPGLGRLLITSRHPFTLPDGAEGFLSFRQLGPLSLAETLKLAWSIPALDQLGEAELGQIWRLVGGHPRSLEYLGALLSGGTARYPDVTRRLNAAVERRLGGADRRRWLRAQARLDAALAEVVTMTADDVLLGALLEQVDRVPGASNLLRGLAVYREPVDWPAVLFQAGANNPDGQGVPDIRAIYRNVQQRVMAVGVDVAFKAAIDEASVPAVLRTELAPYIAELHRRPAVPPGLGSQLRACQDAGLITITGTGSEQRFFVHRWTSAELTRNATGNDGSLLAAHERAANYWLLRDIAQRRGGAQVHDLLEARYHWLAAGDIDAADEVTEMACHALHWGAWDQATAIIHDTLARLPTDSARNAAWTLELASLARHRGDYSEAQRQCLRALEIFERLGDEAQMANAHQHLGSLAQHQGHYAEAERQCQRALSIFERLDDELQMVSAHHVLGIIAQERGNYEEAERQYLQALRKSERLGNVLGMANIDHQRSVLAYLRSDYDEAEHHSRQALEVFSRLGYELGMAHSYNQLGVLASAKDDLESAERLYLRALDIGERLGDQGTMARVYQNLGVLAQSQEDNDEAERQYRRALELLERIGDRAATATSSLALGELARLRQDSEEAERLYRRALDVFEQLGDQANVASICQKLGDLAFDLGDYRKAKPHYRRALEVFEMRADEGKVAGISHRLGMVAQDLADDQEASAHYHRALEIFERLNFEVGMAVAYRRLGMLSWARGDYDEAERQYQRAIELFQRLGDHAETVEIYDQLARRAQDRGDHHEAEQYYQRMLGVFERLGDEQGMADVSHRLAGLAYSDGDHGEAEQWFQRAYNLSESLGDQAGMASASHNLGAIAYSQGNHGEMERQCTRAYDLFETLDDQRGMAISQDHLGMVAQARGSYAEAEQHFRRSLELYEQLSEHAGMARSYCQLGWLARTGGNYEEAERQYQRSCELYEGLGDRAGIAIVYSQRGILEGELGESTPAAVEWHVAALRIRLRLGISEGIGVDLLHLARHRARMGTEPFAELLEQVTEADDARVLIRLIDLFEAHGVQQSG